MIEVETKPLYTCKVFAREQILANSDIVQDTASLLMQFYGLEPPYLPLLYAQIKDHAKQNKEYLLALTYNLDNVPIGCLGLVIPHEGEVLAEDFPDVQATGTNAILVDGYVIDKPEHRRQGIFKTMTTSIIENAKRVNVGTIYAQPAADGRSEQSLRNYEGFTTFPNLGNKSRLLKRL